jgi:hypothetical protein
MDDNLMLHVEKIFDIADGVLTKLLLFMLTPAETKADYVAVYYLVCNYV